MSKQINMKLVLNIANVIGLALCGLFVFYGIRTGIFVSDTALQNFLLRFHGFAPLIFIIFQIVQVIFPVIPGGITTVAGVVIFGPFWGFVYNYIGICVGSIGAFLIAKQYGTPLIKHFASEKVYNKYIKWTDENSPFAKLFALAIFFPVAPDDFLCYLAGTTPMSLKKFTTIILLGKPASIAAYSLGLNLILQHLLSMV